jgi:hypothetical protein
MALVNAFGAVALDVTSVQIRDKLPVLQSTIPGNQTPSIPVRQVGEDITSCTFSDVGSGLLTPDLVQMHIGTGVGVSQGSGNLLITTGTSTNQEYLARSVKSWQGSMMARWKFIASQRIANQNFMVMIGDLVGETLSVVINSATSITVTKADHGYASSNVGQFMFIGGISGAAGVPGRYAIASVPTADTINFTVAGWPASGSCTVDIFGHSSYKVLYNGTTVTAALFDAQRKGWGSGDTTLAVLTTASPGHMGQLQIDGRNAYIADSLVASTASPTVVNRGSRVENIPDDNLDLYLFLWSYNGTAAPASTTTWTIGFWSVEKFANNPVYIQGNRQTGLAAPLPVALPGTQAVSGTVTANQGTFTNPTASNINSAATTNGANIKNAAGTLYSITASNVGAAVAFVKFYNLAAAPTVGTSVPAITIPVPAGGIVNINFGTTGHRMTTGISIAITNLGPDSDTTAVAVNQVKVMTAYI